MKGIETKLLPLLIDLLMFYHSPIFNIILTKLCNSGSTEEKGLLEQSLTLTWSTLLSQNSHKERFFVKVLLEVSNI